MPVVKRITITINHEILKRIDGMVDGKQIRNRSHAIENLITKSLSRAGADTAIILAGGSGAKTAGAPPKAMIPIHGKPVLEHQVAMLRKHGIKNVIVSLGCEKGLRLRENAGIEYVTEKKNLGTSGALYAAMDRIRGTVVVCNVDTLLDPDVHEIIEFHKRQGKIATMLLTTAEKTDKSGVAKMRGNSIVEFVEKPRHSESKLVNAGFYVFEPGIKKFLKKRGPVEKVVFPVLAKSRQLAGYVYDGKVYDVGFPEAYALAARAWKDVS